MSVKTKKSLDLNPNQSKAINHEKGPLLVVAGAGTGKTRVITERIRHLIQDIGIKPQEILALTFTDKAANEMLERVGDVMPLGYEEPWIYTFHAFADRILRAEALEIGIDPSYKLLSGPQQWILLRKNIFKFDIEYFRPLGNPTKFVSDVLKFISRLQDESISPEDFRKYVDSKKGTYQEADEEKRWNELAYIYEQYQKLKLEQSKMDFGDLITWTIKLFNQRPAILKKYQQQFKHTLVDEFQDTNYSQYALVKMLCPQQMQDRSLLVVGDDSQSIYKFRGAAISNILEFMKDYPEAEMVTLLANYRSSQSILDPSYKLVQNNNPDTLEAKLGISKQLTSEIEPKGIKPIIAQAETIDDEVDFVVSKIFEVMAQEPQYTYKDIAILARANSHLEPFLMGLRQHGIPYQLVGNRGLYDREEIQDITAILKTIVSPKETISLYRVLNISTFGIPYEEISSLLSKSRFAKEELWETVKKSKQEQVVNLVTKLNEAQQNITKATPVDFVFSLVQATNFLEKYIKEETIENQLAVKNLNIFLDIVKRFEAEYHNENRTYPTIVDFLDYLELMLEAGDNPAQAELEDIDTVNLLTTHAAKGLEYPVVFMINLVSDRFPTRNKSDAIEIPEDLIKETLPTGNEHIQEERRLFYVGMTRAKKYLYMTLAKNYGGKREKTPSGFLQETGIDLQEITKVEKDSQKQDSLFGVKSGFRDVTAQKIKNFTPDFLSFSQIDTYQNCPLQYKYKYVLHVPTMPSHALSFGITIHDTLRDFHQKMMFEKQVSKETLLEMYQKNWQPLGYKDAEHREKRLESGKKLLEKYYENHKDEHPKHLAIEKPFNIKIDGIKFFGRIDRIDQHPDGTVEIVDYKTGTTKTQKDIDKDMQVAVYAIAAKEALGIEPTMLSYYFVEEGTKLSTTRTEGDLLDTKAELKETVNKIKAGEFEPNAGMQCSWCDYKSICPFAYKS